MLAANTIALREWAVTCDALGAGQQVLLLRTGGIHERAFAGTSEGGVAAASKLEHREFWLVPTHLHAASERLKVSARPRFDALLKQAPPVHQARIALYATVADAIFVDDRDRLINLDPLHHFDIEYVRSRFDFRTPGIWALTLRAWRRAEPELRPLTSAHSGCISWLRFEPPLATGGFESVLSDAEFEERRARVSRALGRDPA